MRTTRLIFEKGFELRRDENRFWFLVPSRDAQVCISPSTITREYGVRPIAWAEQHPSGKELITLYSPTGEQCANPFDLLEMAPDASMLLAFRSLRYVLGAACYHCCQLAQRYSETWCAFHSSPARSKSESDIANFIQLGFQEEGYYEFDALVTSVLRSYDAMRFVIWPAFGGKGGRTSDNPRKNFQKTLNHCEGLPVSLESRLNHSWSVFGAKAKEYRDFIQHRFPLDRGYAQARMGRMKGGVWSVVMLIPDNPEDHSPNKFTYNSETDMLTYGWELTNEILEVAEATVTAVLGAQHGRHSSEPKAP